MMDNTDHLTDKQRAYVQHLASGMESCQAARDAGYSTSFARVAAHRMKKKPAVVRALAAAHAALREKTLFTQEQAVKEIDSQIATALSAKNPNHMAAANLLQLKCKIHGLVREKIEVEVTDLKGALAEARTRVGWVFVSPRLDTLPASKTLIDTRPTGTGPASSGQDGNGQPFGD